MKFYFLLFSILYQPTSAETEITAETTVNGDDDILYTPGQASFLRRYGINIDKDF